MTAIARTRCRL